MRLLETNIKKETIERNNFFCFALNEMPKMDAKIITETKHGVHSKQIKWLSCKRLPCPLFYVFLNLHAYK